MCFKKEKVSLWIVAADVYLTSVNISAPIVGVSVQYLSEAQKPDNLLKSLMLPYQF